MSPHVSIILESSLLSTKPAVFMVLGDILSLLSHNLEH